MPRMELHEIYGDPWGIVASRRAEIEKSSFGGFDKILREEIDRQFLTIASIAGRMGASLSTARNWMRDNDPRFIMRGTQAVYHCEDAMKIIDERKRMAEARKSKKKAKRRAG